jgi:hypothetical protein
MVESEGLGLPHKRTINGYSPVHEYSSSGCNSLFDKEIRFFKVL